MGGKDRILAVLAALFAGAAVAEQLRHEPQERTWHGQLAGVPYDFRPPTLERVRSTVWNPENPSLLASTAFGIGWTVNFYRLLHPLTP
jgi:Family of unknown function (DUF5808)